MGRAYHEATFAHGSDKEAVKLDNKLKAKRPKRKSTGDSPSRRSYEQTDMGPGNSERIGRGYTPANRPFPKRLVQDGEWEWRNQVGNNGAYNVAKKLETIDEFIDQAEEGRLPVRSEVDLLAIARPARRRGKQRLQVEYEFLDGNFDLLSWADDSEWGVGGSRLESDYLDWESDWESDWEDVEDDFQEEHRPAPIQTYAEMLKVRPR